jgi:hypothetical protein
LGRVQQQLYTNNIKMSKTEYRIIPIERCVYNFQYYHQFKYEKYTKKRKYWFFCLQQENKKVEWKYIIEPNHGVYDWPLNQKDSPSKFPFANYRFLHSYNWDQYKLVTFVKNYPDIEVYFQMLRKQRENYLNEVEKERKKAKIIYLGLGSGDMVPFTTGTIDFPEDTHNVLLFLEVEEGEVGRHILVNPASPGFWDKVAPVSLIFTSSKSVQIVIDRLEEIKKSLERERNLKIRHWKLDFSGRKW